jgi:hypothetical protein
MRLAIAGGIWLVLGILVLLLIPIANDIKKNNFMTSPLCFFAYAFCRCSG